MCIKCIPQIFWQCHVSKMNGNYCLKIPTLLAVIIMNHHDVQIFGGCNEIKTKPCHGEMTFKQWS